KGEAADMNTSIEKVLELCLLNPDDGAWVRVDIKSPCVYIALCFRYDDFNYDTINAYGEVSFFC
ncbi:MAG: hypothetical protein EDM79_08230, partial [Chloroflexi bacterium]